MRSEGDGVEIAGGGGGYGHRLDEGSRGVDEQHGKYHGLEVGLSHQPAIEGGSPSLDERQRGTFIGGWAVNLLDQDLQGSGQTTVRIETAGVEPGPDELVRGIIAQERVLY